MLGARPLTAVMVHLFVITVDDRGTRFTLSCSTASASPCFGVRPVSLMWYMAQTDGTREHNVTFEILKSRFLDL